MKGLHSVKGWSHYMTIISRVVTSDGEDKEESVILGVDVKLDMDDIASDETADDDDDYDDDEIEEDDEANEDGDEGSDGNSEKAATVGLILPITSRMSVETAGQWYACLVH